MRLTLSWLLLSGSGVVESWLGWLVVLKAVGAVVVEVEAVEETSMMMTKIGDDCLNDCC